MKWIIEYSRDTDCGKIELFGSVGTLFDRLSNMAGYTLRWRRG